MAARGLFARAESLALSQCTRASIVARSAGRSRFLTRTFASAASDKPSLRELRREAKNEALSAWRSNNVEGGVPAAWEAFPSRHIGPQEDDVPSMLRELGPGAETMESFLAQVIPENVRLPPWDNSNKQPSFWSEGRLNDAFNDIADMNVKGMRWMQGGGYYPTETPPVIRRNILESPAWYTSYTPYQAEISQGRLESLLNFQTMVADLTGLPISNASLLDEGTAAAEAMTLSLNTLSSSRAKKPGKVYVVSHLVHETTRNVLRGRAEGFGLTIKVVDLSAPDALEQLDQLGDKLTGVLVQYPDTQGGVQDHKALADKVHEHGALLTAATDLSALTILTPPGEWGADIAVGNSQRFGVPLGFGGPHAAFMAVKESSKRRLPGRLVGVSKDRLGRPALRLALQTREQHIRREKATSNVCTAQALLANMAAMYAVYHGPTQLRNMAIKNVQYARAVEALFSHYGHEVVSNGAASKAALSDTVTIRLNVNDKAHFAKIQQALSEANIDAGAVEDSYLLKFACVNELGPKLFEDLSGVLATFHGVSPSGTDGSDIAKKCWDEAFGQSGDALLASIPENLRRTSSFLTHPVFNSYHSETEMLRYIHHLQSKDLSLTHAMIPLGSCTMKLNATSQMELISNPRHANIHPLAKLSNADGYMQLIEDLSEDLNRITGMDACTLQPNSGAQGEFAGLFAIRHHLDATSSTKRDICLIPSSAHGTNPASAAMAGMRVVIVKCDPKTGNLDMTDLKAKCEKHKDELAAIMITYPSTFGVFEPDIINICQEVHDHGGQVYMDGANMNAQIGLTSPGALGADVCHLNLHKTFCIPHGGGGPGVGPICVKKHLGPFLPGTGNELPPADRPVPVASANFGSASILPISWAYIKTMGQSSAHSYSTVISH